MDDVVMKLVDGLQATDKSVVGNKEKSARGWKCLFVCGKKILEERRRPRPKSAKVRKERGRLLRQGRLRSPRESEAVRIYSLSMWLVTPSLRNASVQSIDECRVICWAITSSLPDTSLLVHHHHHLASQERKPQVGTIPIVVLIHPYSVSCMSNFSLECSSMRFKPCHHTSNQVNCHMPNIISPSAAMETHRPPAYRHHKTSSASAAQKTHRAAD